MGWLIFALSFSFSPNVLGVRLEGPLVLDPNRTVFYTEAQLAAFYPPRMTISMGAIPSDLFNSSSILSNITIAEPPVIS